MARPKIIDELVLAKLEEAFAYGCTDQEACIYADIDPSTLYRYQQEHPAFCERKEVLKQNPILKARKAVNDALETDPYLALKFLERRKKDEFSPRTELMQANVDVNEMIRLIEENEEPLINPAKWSENRGLGAGEKNF